MSRSDGLFFNLNVALRRKPLCHLLMTLTDWCRHVLCNYSCLTLMYRNRMLLVQSCRWTPGSIWICRLSFMQIWFFPSRTVVSVSLSFLLFHCWCSASWSRLIKACLNHNRRMLQSRQLHNTFGLRIHTCLFRNEKYFGSGAICLFCSASFFLHTQHKTFCVFAP